MANGKTRSIACVTLLMLAASALFVRAQSAAVVAATTFGEAPVREIDDPSSGARWLLYRDTSGGPGKLVLAGQARTFRISSQPQPQPLPVIHAGDRIVVEENTPVVAARLEAVALSAAIQGDVLRVRLSLGGHILKATALGPGRAGLLPNEEAQ